MDDPDPKESAMLRNLTDVLGSEGKVVEMQVEPELTEISSKAGTYAIESMTPLSLTLTNIGMNKASVKGTVAQKRVLYELAGKSLMQTGLQRYLYAVRERLKRRGMRMRYICTRPKDGKDKRYL